MCAAIAISHSARAGSRAGSREDLDKGNRFITNPRLREIFCSRLVAGKISHDNNFCIKKTFIYN